MKKALISVVFIAFMAIIAFSYMNTTEVTKPVSPIAQKASVEENHQPEAGGSAVNTNGAKRASITFNARMK